MLRQVYVLKNGQPIYFQHFGKALDDESFNSVVKKIETDAFSKSASEEEIQTHDYYKFRLSFLSKKDQRIIFLFVTDLTDKATVIEKELSLCKREFLDLFEDILDQPFDEETFEVFNPTVERIHKNMRPKISLVGFSGVGKTTITRLIRAEEIPMEHVPTITGEIATIRIGKLSFHLWDFAGQEQFSFLWNKFVKGSDAVLIITDSTIENCEKSRFFTELIKQEAPHAHVAVIGNKQDLPDALPVTEIERMLGGIHAYSMVATDDNNRDKMITIIADILEMSAEVSPLLKPLIERDKKTEEAEKALIEGDFTLAYQLFNEIGDLCLELGDDTISTEFYEKADKVKAILDSQPAAPPPAAQAPPAVPEKPAAGGQEGAAPGPAKPAGAVGIPSFTVKPAGNGAAQPKPPSVKPPSFKPPAFKPPSLKPPGAQPAGNGLAQPKPPSMKPPSFKPPAFKPPSVKPPSFKPPSFKPPTMQPPTSQVPPNKPAPAAKPGAKPPGLSIQTGFAQPVGNPDSINAPGATQKPATGPAQSFKPPALQGGGPAGNPQAQPVPGPQQAAPQQTTPPQTSPYPAPPSQYPAQAGPQQAAPTAGGPTASQSANLQQTIMDLKIKLANINKVLLDKELENISGTLSDEQYQQQAQRLEAMKGNIQGQIQELEALQG